MDHPVYINKKYKTLLAQPLKPSSNIYSAGSSKSQPAPAGISILVCYGFNTQWLQRRRLQWTQTSGPEARVLELTDFDEILTASVSHGM